MKVRFTKLYMKFIKIFKCTKTFKSSIFYIIQNNIIKAQSLFKKKNFVYTENITLNDPKKINIAFLGEVNSQCFNSKRKINNVIKLLDYPDIVLYYGNNEFFETANSQIVNISKNDRMVLEFNNAKIGIANIDFNGLLNKKDIEQLILKEKNILKKEHCSFIVACIKPIKENKKNIPYKKITGLCGFDYVIGFEENLYHKKNYRCYNFGSTRILYSLGTLTNDRYNLDTSYKYIAHAIALRCQLYIGDKKIKLLKEGFIPLYVIYSEICYMEKRNLYDKSEEYIQSLKHVYHQMRGFRNWYEIFTVGDIAKQLNIQLPDKYNLIKGSSVNMITARTFETGPGTVFFFRQQFNDNNDKKLQNEFIRTKMALKVFIRKNLFIFSYKKLPFFIPHIVVNDAREAHIQTMAWYKKQFANIPFIGITGSIGKTSTKDMIFSVLNQKFSAERNLRNTNVQVKIGLNLQNMLPDTEVFVQEIGGGRPGGASRHARMVLPDIAVITNIGTAHIGNFGSQELLMENKLGITEGMNKDGILLLNGDDPLLINAKVKQNVIYYAVDNKMADYYVEDIAEDIVKDSNKTFFTIVHGNHRTRMCINYIGKYNLLNAVCAYAIGKLYGMTDKDISIGLMQFQTSGVRQNIIKVGGYTLFMDCYNASLESVKTSLSVLDKLSIQVKKKKIAIIGDLTGVGELQEEINTELANTLAIYNFDNIVCYGHEAQEVCNKLKYISDKISCIAINDAVSLEKWMISNINIGDIVLLKGSSKAKLDERVDNVFGTNTCDQRYIDEAKYITLKTSGFEYKIFEENVSIKKYKSNKKTLRVKNKILGKNITKLWPYSMANNNFERVILPPNLKIIDKGSFANCHELKEIIIPDSVKYIGDEAFVNCANLEKVKLPEELIHLGENVFKQCYKLNQ